MMKVILRALKSILGWVSMNLDTLFQFQIITPERVKSPKGKITSHWFMRALFRSITPRTKTLEEMIITAKMAKFAKIKVRDSSKNASDSRGNSIWFCLMSVWMDRKALKPHTSNTKLPHNLARFSNLRWSLGDILNNRRDETDQISNEEAWARGVSISSLSLPYHVSLAFQVNEFLSFGKNATYLLHKLSIIDHEFAKDLGLGEVLLNVGFLLTNDADRESRTRKRMTMNQFRGQSKLLAQNAHLRIFNRIQCNLIHFISCDCIF